MVQRQENDAVLIEDGNRARIQALMKQLTELPLKASSADFMESLRGQLTPA